MTELKAEPERKIFGENVRKNKYVGKEVKLVLLQTAFSLLEAVPGKNIK